MESLSHGEDQSSGFQALTRKDAVVWYHFPSYDFVLECQHPWFLCPSASTQPAVAWRHLPGLLSMGRSSGCFLAEHFFQKPHSICSEEADQREGISGRGSGMNSNDTRGCRGIRRLCAQAPH